MKIYQDYYDEFKPQWMFPSKSEERLLKYITDKDLDCLHVGLSTGWFWELISAKMNLNRKIIGTTIDKKGLEFSENLFRQNWVSDQIEIKLEDVTTVGIYENNQFDIVYARLVLHYISKYEIQKTVDELYRITKEWWKLLVVVKSVNNAWKHTTYDDKAGLHISTYYDAKGDITWVGKRYYHSEETIRNTLESSWFTVSSIESYDEKLCKDYSRTLPSPVLDSVIEVICHT